MTEEIKNNMSKDWKEVKLSEVLELKNGERPKINDYGIIPVYGANGIMGKTNDFLIDNDFTIIVGRVGASGEIHLAKGKVWISDNAIYSQSYKSKKIHLPFLFYSLTFKNLKQFATKTTHPIITQSFLKNLLILLPPLPEQQKIAEILSTVDSAIEKVNQAIEKTQRLKKGLMQELLTKGIGHKEFKDTEIGRIPKEWEVVRIKDIGEVFTGKTPSTSKDIYWNGDIPFITPEDMTGEKYVYKANRHVTFEGANQSGKILPPNTVLVVCIGSTVGKVALTYKESVTNQQINSILCKEKAHHDYVYYAISHRSFMLKNYSGVAAVPIVKKSLFEEFKIPLPQKINEQQKIAKILSTVDKKLELLKKKKEKLERIKKGLMNDLLTGKRRTKYG